MSPTHPGSDAPALRSSLLGGRESLQEVARGAGSTVELDEDALCRVRMALLNARPDVADWRFDGHIDDNLLEVARQYATARGVPPDPPLGPELIRLLDREWAWAEGTIMREAARDSRLMARDPLLGIGIVDAGRARDRLEQLLSDVWTGDTVCSRLSATLSPLAASCFSEYVAEPAIFKDYCAQRFSGRCSTSSEFLDNSKSFKPYQEYLERLNPGAGAVSGIIARLTRPDIISHRPPIFEWYEIKALSASGIRSALSDYTILKLGYPARGFPYTPGTLYIPTRDLPLTQFRTSAMEYIDVYLEVLRPMEGLIFWSLCLRGDAVRFLRRVGIVAAMLAVMIALIEAAAAAAAAAAEAGAVVWAAAVIAELRALALALGVSAVPVLRTAH